MRGLKLIVLAECHVTHVAPYVGAWIETTQVVTTLRKCLSHPTWVRGLKPRLHGSQCQNVFVAPYVGAWIETECIRFYHISLCVAPYVGAWIETTRDLKLNQSHSVAPYVGAWIETYPKASNSGTGTVAPYVGAWIETDDIQFLHLGAESHPTWVRGLKHHYVGCH